MMIANATSEAIKAANATVTHIDAEKVCHIIDIHPIRIEMILCSDDCTVIPLQTAPVFFFMSSAWPMNMRIISLAL